MFPDVAIQNLKGVGEKRAEQFHALDIHNINDLLHHYPRTYENWSAVVPILGAELSDTPVCVQATVVGSVGRFRAKSGITVFEARAMDETGTMKIIIFNNKYAAAKLQQGQTFLFYGRMTIDGNKREMLSPAIESPQGRKRIRPIYRTTKNMTSRYIEGCVEKALSIYAPMAEDPIPYDVREKYGLLSLTEALQEIHFPSSMERMSRARNRFIFEELLELQIGLARIRKDRRKAAGVRILDDCTEEFYATLPFEPTGAQKRAVAAAIEDMQSGELMNRLLQGDVGSGKTMVGAALCHTAARNGFQSAMMAPTEILAGQHYATMAKFFEGTGIQCALLTGSTSAKDKADIKAGLASGAIDFVVGTHALITDDVQFHNLGLVITDEQHRFGVGQRGSLARKGDGAHVLVMSATPIPRTLALAIYGDLDVSVIDELPKGRQPIETYRINSKIRERAYNYIKKFLDEGRQGYIVCPLVEEGDETTADLMPATEYYKRICQNEFKDYRVGLLHGQMKNADKDDVMERFVSGEIQLLVSTTVIEVGVDVPNAVIMLIENAERFGLSQLHQLRGRVGRGKYQSTCILLSDSRSPNTAERLKVMTETNDGFVISQKDLALRGPGDFFGRRQHGLPELRIADMMEDMDVLATAGEAARKILADDPELALPEHQLLAEETDLLFAENLGTA
ncbi:MAG: ATP-dependent DNA helicase RecG, partial [Clostridia bacterium]|nr:ATP-dependent DNA helicase RecG [Clostridia bacterium]